MRMRSLFVFLVACGSEPSAEVPTGSKQEAGSSLGSSDAGGLAAEAESLVADPDPMVAKADTIVVADGRAEGLDAGDNCNFRIQTIELSFIAHTLRLERCVDRVWTMIYEGSSSAALENSVRAPLASVRVVPRDKDVCGGNFATSDLIHTVAKARTTYAFGCSNYFDPNTFKAVGNIDALRTLLEAAAQ
jgi:hypothetical protein